MFDSQVEARNIAALMGVSLRFCPFAAHASIKLIETNETKEMRDYTLTESEAAQWDGGAIEHDGFRRELETRFKSRVEVYHPDGFMIDVFGPEED